MLIMFEDTTVSRSYFGLAQRKITGNREMINLFSELANPYINSQSICTILEVG